MYQLFPYVFNSFYFHSPLSLLHQFNHWFYFFYPSILQYASLSFFHSFSSSFLHQYIHGHISFILSFIPQSFNTPVFPSFVLSFSLSFINVSIIFLFLLPFLSFIPSFFSTRAFRSFSFFLFFPNALVLAFSYPDRKLLSSTA